MKKTIKILRFPFSIGSLVLSMCIGGCGIHTLVFSEKESLGMGDIVTIFLSFIAVCLIVFFEIKTKPEYWSKKNAKIIYQNSNDKKPPGKTGMK